MREYPKVTITKKAEISVRNGHPWVYFDEVIKHDDALNGSLVDVISEKGKYLGIGFYNECSKIRVRIISKNTNDKFDRNFWYRRVKYAIDYRRTVMGKSDFNCCRLIFGEADAFPGLTVDRFGNVLVTETLSLGIEKNKDIIFPLIIEYLRQCGENIDVLYERNDGNLRKKEGLDVYNGYYDFPKCEKAPTGETQITENGIVFNVNYIEGQKTGFFLDQKYNRLAIRKIAEGRNVLDCFTHTGAFALNAALGGAEKVTAVDISSDALQMARRNAQANNISNVNFVCSDVFEYLKELESDNHRDFDFIILDPPAFTKSRDTLKNAIRGYREINAKAMKLLPRGGYLATCSCSHFMNETYFKQMIHNAAEDSGISLRQIEARQQSPDHPILWNVPETDYLKFFIFQVV